MSMQASCTQVTHQAGRNRDGTITISGINKYTLALTLRQDIVFLLQIKINGALLPQHNKPRLSFYRPLKKIFRYSR